jgi:glycosyltransferase involved in cell wall biosynthesis
MNGKKILMIINFFPPAGGGGVYRPLAFVKYLSRLSWGVTVVTTQPGEFWISDPGLEAQVPPEVRVVRTASLSGFRLLRAVRGGPSAGAASRRSSSGFGALRRLGEHLLVPDTYRGWVPFASRAASELCRAERFDIIYSTSPPDSSHLAALSVARRFGIPWVADFRDPWINLHLRKPPTPLHRMLHKRLEASVAARALLLVTTLAQEEMFRRDYPGARIARIPNGYDEEDFAGLDERPLETGPFIISHVGMLTLGRSTRPFLEGLALLKRRSPGKAAGTRVVFIGARESANEEWVHSLALAGTAVFEDNLPHREVVRREKRSHALLLIKHDDERYRGLVPGKLFEYIGARRPILGVVPEGEAAAIIRDLRRGEVAPLGDPAAVAAALERMYDRRRAGDLDRAYALDEVPRYSRRAETEELSRALERLIGEDR